jgi:hypothetical protein
MMKRKPERKDAMALLIKAARVAVPVTPKNGRQFTVAELQGYVGAHLEALPLSSGQIMWLNEEDKLKHLAFNALVDEIAHEQSSIAPLRKVVGDVLIATRTETDGRENQEESNGYREHRGAYRAPFRRLA